MARKSSIERQRKRQRCVTAKWQQRRALKEIIRDPHHSLAQREEAQFALNKLPRNSSSVRLRNRCLVTGRARGYLRKFQLSRICFREAANRGEIPGVFKASW